jgi:SRSO17 transposase
MDFIVNESDTLCDAFFENFAPIWSRPNQAQGFRAYVLGLLSEAHRKNVEALSAKVIDEPYQSLHHFLADAPWDAAELNRRRLDLLRNDTRTAPSDKGILILDDTGVPKKGEATEGVKRQYIGQVGKTANGQVFVTSHYADSRCHWPVEIVPYVPDVWLAKGKQDERFRTKLQLALELIDRAVAMKLPFRAVVADSWYGREPFFVQELDQRGLPYVLELRSSDRIFARLPGDIASNEHRLKEAASLLKREDFRPARLMNADGTKREVQVAGLRVKIKGVPLKRRMVLVTTRPEDPASDQDARWLLTNLVTARNDTVAQLYAWRNWVEEFYREAKDDLGAGQYQVRDLQSILRHWLLVFVAYALLVQMKRQGRLQRWCKKNSTPCDRP